MAAACLAIVLLAGSAASAGVFLRGDGTVTTATSPRGEVVDYAADGVYRFNALRIVAEGSGWDVFTLFFAVPALFAAVPSIARYSFRGRLFAVGMLAYVFYQYLMYALAWALGPLFPLFIVIFAASLAVMIWILSDLGIASAAERFSARFPRRGMAILCLAMAAVLLLMWVARIAAALGGAVDGILLGQTTLVVQALDLGLIVPLAVFTAVAALRGSAIGYVLSSTLVVKAVAMSVAICAMLVGAWKTEGRLEILPFVLFATAAVVATCLGVRMYRSITPAEAGASPASRK
jgi:hypothetical protein